MKPKILLIVFCSFMLPSLSYGQAGGASTDIQYNNSGALGGSANFAVQLSGTTVYGVNIQSDPTYLNQYIGVVPYPDGNATATGIGNDGYGGANLNSLTTGTLNVAIAPYALYAITTGSQNVAIGSSAGLAYLSSAYNVAIGPSSDATATSDSFCVAVGNEALSGNTGNKNTAVGYEALGYNSSGVHNVGIGYGGLGTNLTGQNNVGVGYDAGGANEYGSYNTYLGDYPNGGHNVNGSYNTYVGYLAGPNADGYSNCASLGYDATVTASNSIQIGNSSVTFTGLNGAMYSSSYSLIIGTTTSNGNGAYCTTGGTWSAPSSITYKTDLTPLDGNDILKKINELTVEGWKYKGTNEYHIGPFAGQFYNLFHTGLDSMHISYVDPAGVALLGVKQLIKYNNSKDSIIAQQQQQLTTQQSEIDQLNTVVSKLDVALSQCCSSYQSTTGMPQTGNGNTTNDIPSLNQNIPNPFSQNTTISCYVPTTAQNASIVVYNLQGEELKSFTVPVTGFNQVMVVAGTLAAGSYLYTLFVNGQRIDTKTMVLTH